MLLAEKLVELNLVGHAFNFSNEIQLTALEIVERILTLMDSPLTPDIKNEVTHEIRHQYLSAAKARQMLNWQPLFTIDQGLQQTASWYQEFLASVGV